MTIEELHEKTIEELHDMLRKSQDSYYGGDIKYRLSDDEHWRTWGMMWKLACENKKVGS